MQLSSARSISEEFSSGDTPRFKDEESVERVETMAVVSGGSAAGCSSGGSSTHHRPDSQLTHKSDKSDKEKEKKEKEREEKDIGKHVVLSFIFSCSVFTYIHVFAF